MNDWVLIATSLTLLLLSAYFASTETAMMKLNPYRLQSLVNQRHGGAIRCDRLLQRKDRLLGVILIGNNLVNFSAVVIANVLFVRWFGTELGGIITTVTTTFVFLVFAEIAPKTIAAERPERIAFPSAYLLTPLSYAMKYLVIAVNSCANLLVKPFIRQDSDSDALNERDLRTIFEGETDLPRNRSALMNAFLDIEDLRVEDLMIPRNQIDAIDIQQPVEQIENLFVRTQHARLPVIDGDFEHVLGVLHMSDQYSQLQALKRGEADWTTHLEPIVYIPKSVSVGRQLRKFGQKKYRFGLVVDEFGQVVGVLGIELIITALIGNFMGLALNPSVNSITELPDGDYRVTGSTRILELNRSAGFDLPDRTAHTINGLILERLRGSVPSATMCLKIDSHVVEVEHFADRVVKTAIIRKG